MALVVLEKPAEPAGREAPVVSESPVVRAAQVVLESPAVPGGAQVVLESPVGRGWRWKTRWCRWGRSRSKSWRWRASASRPRSPAEAVALTVSAVINPQRAGAAEAAALSAEEAGHLPKRPAIAVAAAWEVGEEGAVVAAEAAAAAKKEAAAKRRRRGTRPLNAMNEQKTFRPKTMNSLKLQFLASVLAASSFVCAGLNSGAAAEIGYRGWSAA